MPKHGGGNPNDKPNNFNLAVKKLMHYFLLGIVISIITAGFANLGHLTGLSVR